MLNKQLHPVRSGIIATVVGGLILSAIPKVRGFLVEALSWIWAGAAWIWGALVSQYSITGWIFLISGSFAFVGFVLLCVTFWLRIKPENEPAYRSYTKDVVYGAEWRWSWNGNELSNLWCFCPNCDAQLICSQRYDGKADFICERCPPDPSNSSHLPSFISPGSWQRCPSDGADRHYGTQGRVITTIKCDDRFDAVGPVKREILRRIRMGENVTSNS